MDIKKSLKDVIVLVVICAVFATVLAAVNSVTAPIIEEQLAGAANQAYEAVMPDAEGFEDIDLSTYTLPATVVEAKRETSGKGYAIKLETKGYGNGMVLIVGVSTDGTVTGATCVTSNETNGDEKTYGGNFAGKDKDGVQAVELIAGSTLTTQAYRSAVVDAINAATILGGGSADIRTEEQILADNLAAALPEGEGAFTKLFMVEVTEGVNKIYVADNGKGYVCVLGEGETAEFIGVGADGVALGESANKAVAEAAVVIVKATATTDVAIDEYKSSTDINVLLAFMNITSVKKTETGNYIFEIQADGYGIKGDYGASGEYISMKVSISADGKVIDAQTVKHSETDNIGGAQLKDGAYNSNFIGKTNEESNAVDTVTDCTVTTTAFKTAIMNCFAAINTIEGGATNE